MKLGNFTMAKCFMRRSVWMGFVVCLAANAVTTRHPSTTYAIREWNFKGCHFKMTDPYNGRTDIGSYIAIINPKAQRPFETWIVFLCEKKKADDAFLGMGMRRSGKNWVLAKEKYQPTPEEHATIYQLHNPKWTGALATFDQTFEDPEDRIRHLGFCIASAHQVLCGVSERVMYLSHPKESTLPQVIKLLESIEFIDTPVKEGTPAGSVSP